MAAINAIDAGQRRALLLHYVGSQTFDDFQTLPDTGDNYQNAKEKLTNHFNPQHFTEYNIAVFRNMKQKSGESIFYKAKETSQAV